MLYLQQTNLHKNLRTIILKIREKELRKEKDTCGSLGVSTRSPDPEFETNPAATFLYEITWFPFWREDPGMNEGAFPFKTLLGFEGGLLFGASCPRFNPWALLWLFLPTNLYLFNWKTIQNYYWKKANQTAQVYEQICSFEIYVAPYRSDKGWPNKWALHNLRTACVLSWRIMYHH